MKTSLQVLSAITLVLIVEAGLIYINQAAWKVAVNEPYNNRLDWATKWGGIDFENAKAVVVSGGEIYVAGTTRSYGAGLSDIFLLKFDRDGALVWNRTWGGPFYDGSWATAADNEGIYVAGFTYQWDNIKANAALLKYDSDGNLVWARTWGGVDDAVGRGIAIDPSGAVYITGYIRGNTTTTKSFLLKYNQSGELIWSKTFGSEGVNAFAVGASDGIYVDGTNETIKNNQWRSNMFLIKFDEAGSILWTRQWGSNPINYCYAISVSGDNIYQAGTTSDGPLNFDAILLNYDALGNLRYNVTWGKTQEQYAWGVIGGSNYIYLVGHIVKGISSSYDSLVVKFSTNGAPMWNATWGDNNVDVAHSVAVEGNDIYVAGITGTIDKDSQVFLLRYISANEVSSPEASWAAAAATAIGVMTLTALYVKKRMSNLSKQAKPNG